MSAVYIDAGVLLHSLGTDAQLRSSCSATIEMLGSGALRGEAAVLTVEEVVHVRHRRSGNRGRSAREGLAFAALLVLHDVREADLELGLELFSTHGSLQPRDAIHVAVATRLGLAAILTTDADFDGLAHLRRVDPRDREAVATLSCR